MKSNSKLEHALHSALVVPLLNPNETEARVVQVHVENGQHVRIGELVCTLETTKAAADLEATQDGYILGLNKMPGQVVRSGDTFCYIAEDPGWQPPQESGENLGSKAGGEALSSPPGLRITQPALKLAQQMGINLEGFSVGELVTESMVRSLAGTQVAHGEGIKQASQIDPLAIIVYGAGGHGKSVIELINALGKYHLHGVIDDDPSVRGLVAGQQVLGGAEKLPDLWAGGIRQAANAVGGIGNIETRSRVFVNLLQAGFTCPPLIHPSAVIEPSAQLAEGVQVMPLAYIGSEASIGFGCLINTGAIISHDCIIDEYSNIAPGAILAGEVKIGSGVLVGMGVTINLRVHIGAGARLGNGCTIKQDVPEGSIVRAGATWPT